MKQIKIIYTKHPTGFGKPKKHEYEGVIFNKGKVVYVDEDDTVCTCDNEEGLKKELKKSGEVHINDHQ